MIIACPACATRYEVPESAVGPDGRTVRCAKCRHSWFEDGSIAFEDLPPLPAEDEGEGATTADETAAPTPSARGAVPAEAQADLADDEVEEPAPVEEQAPTAPAFASRPPRRSRVRLWGWAAVIVAVLGGATAAAASYWGLPDWMPVQRSAMSVSRPGLELNFPAERQERRQLPNGTEFFGASGTITNVDSEAQTVPPILIVLRDERDRIVFSWEVAPPKRSLKPGESITVNEAMTDVPRSARVAEIGWKPV